MKKIFSAAALVCLAGVMVYAQQKQQPGPQDTKQQPEPTKVSYRDVGAVLPALRIVDTTGKAYTAGDFSDQHHFFMVMFNPTCGHCIQMGKLMGDHIDEFGKNQIVFMAGPAMLPYMASFYQASGLGKHTGIKVGVDSAGVVEKVYNYQTLPQINIYDKDRKLVKIFYGDTPIDSLRKYIP